MKAASSASRRWPSWRSAANSKARRVSGSPSTNVGNSGIDQETICAVVAAASKITRSG
jgi:hypothetical protein